MWLTDFMHSTADFPIISGKDARAQGLRFCFTGVPCVHGHLAPREVVGGHCTECKKENRRAYYAVNRDRLRADNARRRREKPGNSIVNSKRVDGIVPAEKRRAGKMNGRLTPETMLTFKLQQEPHSLRRYGPPAKHGSLKNIATARPDACERCGDAHKICADHDHDTGEFRGWLCTRCNSSIGFANDDPARLRDLADYLDGRQPAKRISVECIPAPQGTGAFRNYLEGLAA